MGSIVFSCEPSDAQELMRQVNLELDRLREHGFEDREIASVREQERRVFEQTLRTNSFWESTIISLYFSRAFPASGCEIGQAVNNWKSTYDQAIKSLSPASAKATLLRVLPKDGVHAVVV